MRTHRVTPFAGALIQSGAVTVDAGILADRFPCLRYPLRYASPGVRLDHEARFAGAAIGTHAPFVGSATICAERWDLVGRNSGSRLGTSAGIGIHRQSIIADA